MIGQLSLVVVANHFPRATANLPSVMARAVVEVGDEVVTAAQGFAPVDTGHLRDNIRREGGGLPAVTVRAGAHYSIYQEFGTRYQSGTPFMRPAVMAVQPRIPSIVGDLTGALLG